MARFDRRDLLERVQFSDRVQSNEVNSTDFCSFNPTGKDSQTTEILGRADNFEGKQSQLESYL